MPEGHEPELARSLVPLHWRASCLCGKWQSDYLHLLKDDARADWNDAHWVIVRAKPILHRAVISDGLLLPGVSCECFCPDGKVEQLGHFSDHNSARLAWRKHAGA